MAQSIISVSVSYGSKKCLVGATLLHKLGLPGLNSNINAQFVGMTENLLNSVSFYFAI